MTILKTLLNLGIQPNDAQALENAFANEPDFLGGLEVVARILATQEIPAFVPLAGEPWRSIHQALINSNGAGLDAAFSQSIAQYNPATQMAIGGAVTLRMADIQRWIAQSQTQGKRKKTSEYLNILSKLGYGFRYNLCSHNVEMNGQAITDTMESEINCKLRDHGIHEINVIKDVYIAEAWKNRYHPIRDYLCSLKFQGGDPIGELSNYFIDNQGVFPVWLRRWLIGAVARAMVQVQNRMLVLDGYQGMGKDQFTKWLCSPLPEYFHEGAIFPDDKDCRLRLLSTWIWDVNELGSTTRRSDREALKAFLTLENVRDRKPFGHFDIQGSAITSFIGTINNEGGILSDPTGTRRFMIARLEGIDWAYTKLDVDQIWAQAFDLYISGVDWNLSDDEKQAAEEINETYQVTDIVEETIRKYFVIDPSNQSMWLSSLEIMDVLKDPLMGNLKAGTEVDSRRMAAALTKLGLEKPKPKRVQGAQNRGYYGIRKAP